MNSETICQNCGSGGMSVFYEARNVPIHSCYLLPTRQEAKEFPRRDIALGFCASCGFIGNVIFDSSVMHYSQTYEEQQAFSAQFTRFAEELAGRLVNRYQLRGKQVVEIGCGKGDFLALLCELGSNRGIGIDPSYIEGRLQSPAASRIQFIRDFYSERYAHLGGDLLCCRHTLEHIYATRDFVRTIRLAVGERTGTVIFFEVPDVRRVLREGAFWDIYYEHCSYFSLSSLARLFRSCGFRVLDIGREYDEQYLVIEAQPENGHPSGDSSDGSNLEQEAQDVACFAEKYRASVDGWRRRFDLLQSQGRRLAIWGSGSKCVAFLSALGIDEEFELAVVDINPHRHHKYLPGTGRQILPPSVLREYQPDTVIAMNPIYCHEIQQDLERMELHPELQAV